MITSEVRVKICFEESDKNDLLITVQTLEDIRKAFEDAGIYHTTEVQALKTVEHIVNEIQRGETF